MIAESHAQGGCSTRCRGDAPASDRTTSERDSRAERADTEWDRLRRFVEGDPSAARELVACLYPLVISIIRSHVRDRSIEEGLAQSVFLKMFTRLHQFRGPSPLSSWVAQIAARCSLDHIRKLSRLREIRMADFSKSERQAFYDAAGDCGRTRTDRVSNRQLIQELLEQLSPSDRLVIQLVYIEGRSSADAGREMGIKKPLVKIRAHRARAKLQRLLVARENGCREIANSLVARRIGVGNQP